MATQYHVNAGGQLIDATTGNIMMGPDGNPVAITLPPPPAPVAPLPPPPVVVDLAPIAAALRENQEALLKELGQKEGKSITTIATKAEYKSWLYQNSAAFTELGPGVADRVWGVVKNGTDEVFTEEEQEKCQKLADSIRKKLRNEGDKKNSGALALCSGSNAKTLAAILSKLD